MGLKDEMKERHLATGVEEGDMTENETCGTRRHVKVCDAFLEISYLFEAVSWKLCLCSVA
jgi:hypothetical protein